MCCKHSLQIRQHAGHVADTEMSIITTLPNTAVSCRRCNSAFMVYLLESIRCQTNTTSTGQSKRLERTLDYRMAFFWCESVLCLPHKRTTARRGMRSESSQMHPMVRPEDGQSRRILCIGHFSTIMPTIGRLHTSTRPGRVVLAFESSH